MAFEANKCGCVALINIRCASPLIRKNNHDVLRPSIGQPLTNQLQSLRQHRCVSLVDYADWRGCMGFVVRIRRLLIAVRLRIAMSPPKGLAFGPPGPTSHIGALGSMLNRFW